VGGVSDTPSRRCLSGRRRLAQRGTVDGAARRGRGGRPARATPPGGQGVGRQSGARERADSANTNFSSSSIFLPVVFSSANILVSTGSGSRFHRNIFHSYLFFVLCLQFSVLCSVSRLQILVETIGMKKGETAEKGLTAWEVAERYRTSRARIWERKRSGHFPKPDLNKRWSLQVLEDYDRRHVEVLEAADALSAAHMRLRMAKKALRYA